MSTLIVLTICFHGEIRKVSMVNVKILNGLFVALDRAGIR